MKTPSLLSLLVLCAALPAVADPTPPSRCDNTFLNLVTASFTGIGSVVDPRIVSADQNVGGITMRGDVLKLNEAKTCDVGTWRQLSTGATPVWRNAGAKKYWDAGNAKENAALLLAVDDLYKTIDPKVAAVLAASEEVLAAGFALDVAKPMDTGATHLAFIKANSGGAFLANATKVYGPTVIAPIGATTGIALIPPADQKGGSITPETAGPTWRKPAAPRSCVFVWRWWISSRRSRARVSSIKMCPSGPVPPFPA